MRNNKRKARPSPKKAAKLNQKLDEARQAWASGRVGQAETLYQQLVEQHPGFADAWFHLGSLYKQIRKFGRAIDCLERACELCPGEKNHWSALAEACQQANRMLELEPVLRKLVDFEPASPIALLNLGICLKKLNKSVQAIEYLERGLKYDPTNIVGRSTLAFALLDIGETEQTRELLLEVKQDDPDNVIVLRQLALMTRHEDYSDDIKHMEKLFDSNLSNEDRSLLGFAVAKAFDDIGETERSFSYLERSNALKRETFEYSIPDRGNYFDEIRSVFTREFIESIPALENTGVTPVFVIGMPRSGTSLVEQILASHSRVYGAGELSCLSRGCMALSNALGTAFPGSFQQAPVEQLQDLGRQYISELIAAADGSPIVVDKLPHNFIFAGVVLSLFDNAKIVHCERDPMATCYSIYRNSFGGHHGYAYSQEELGSYYLLYERLMAHWQVVAPERIYTASYEALVANPRDETEKLLAYCGLDTEAACFEFYKTRRVVGTVSNTQVRRPIYKDSLAGWMRYEKELKPMQEALKYSGPR